MGKMLEIGLFAPRPLHACSSQQGTEFLGPRSCRPSIREGAARVFPVLVFLGIAATLLAPGLDGVRRWLVLGPIRLNMSAALVPWLALGFVASNPGVRSLPVLTGGAIVNRRIGVPVAAVLLAIAAATWSRPDPLPPLDHVERILVLTASRGAPWLLGAALANRVMATFFGNFPVPVFGAGAGPILGWYALPTTLHSAPILLMLASY